MIICTETGTEEGCSIYANHFPHHTAFHIHSRANNVFGSGISVLVGPKYASFTSVWRVDEAVGCIWVRVAKEATHFPRDLFICGCYIPPSSSAQMRPCNTLADRFDSLLQHTAQATAAGYVILAGDMNARVADATDLLDPAPHHILPHLRGCSDPIINATGPMLLDVCLANHLALLTGRMAGDQDAASTFNGGNGTSRPDHVAVSHELYHHVQSHSVLPYMMGSDHYPIATSLLMAAPPPPIRDPPPTTPLPPRVRWQHACQARFYSQLMSEEVQTAMADTTSHLPVGLDAAVSTFVATLKEAAIAAGCRSTSASGTPVRRTHHKPWFDRTCREALRALRHASATHAPASPPVLACQRRFRNVCQQRKQEHKKVIAMEFASLLRADPNRLWRALQHRDRSSAASVCPADPHTCGPYFSSVFNPVTTPHVAHAPPPPTPHIDLGSPSDCSDAAFNASITAVEVHAALCRLKNGKSPGMDGLPSELLKYACPPCTDAPTSHLNPLIAPLTAIFNHLLTHSVVPGQWSATLVTLLYKKGDPTLWANYRPIAIVQLLTKVYAMILHHRLSSWAESTGR